MAFRLNAGYAAACARPGARVRGGAARTAPRAPGSHRGERLRRLPHRPSRRRRRVAARASPVIPGTKSSGTWWTQAARSRPFARGDRVGVPWLALTCGSCRYCGRPGEPLRAPLHGLQGRRRLREACLADARFCLAMPDRDPCARDAAPVRGADRLSRLGRPARASAGPLRLRCGRAPPRAGRPGAGTPSVRVHAARRRSRSTSRAPSVRSGPAGRREPARAARRRHHLRAGRRPGAAALARGRKGGRVVCAGIHMSDIPPFL